MNDRGELWSAPRKQLIDEIEQLGIRIKMLIQRVWARDKRIAKLEGRVNSLITDIALCEVKLEEALETK